MSKSQDFSHARQLQSVKKTKNIARKKSKEETKTNVCHSSRRIPYVEQFNIQTKKIEHQKKGRHREINK